MAKYSDINGMGKSELIPRKVEKDETASERHIRRLTKDETASERHIRRLTYNMSQVAHITAWCTHQEIAISITNNGHHWKLEYHKKLAHWWPSSAKLVFDKHYKRGIHCHDIEQLKRALIKRWKLRAN